MKQTLKIFLPILLCVSAIFAQSIEANWTVQAIFTEYIYEVRDVYPAPGTSPEDSELTYTSTVSWPSSGQALWSTPVNSFTPDDTLSTLWLPFPNPDILAIAGGLITGDWTSPGIAIDVFFDDSGDDAGQFEISGGSTFPTTTTENCSTAAVISDADSYGQWAKQPGYWNNTDGIDNDGDGEVDEDDEGHSYTFGNGILESSILALFSAPDLVNGVYGVDYGTTPESYEDVNGNGEFDAGVDNVVGGELTAMPSWGKSIVTYTYDADGNQVPLTMNLYWETHPGVLEDSGIDADGLINQSLGLPTLPSDTVSVTAAIALAIANGVEPVNPTDHPVIGAGGLDAATAAALGMIPAEHADSTVLLWQHDHASGTLLPPGQQPYSHGNVSANKGVLFDPTSPGFAPTGGYMTLNTLMAGQIFGSFYSGYLQNGVDGETAGIAAAGAVGSYLEADSATVGNAASATLLGIYNACIDAGADEATCHGAVGTAGGTVALTTTAAVCDTCWVDDSDVTSGWEDYYGYMIPTPGQLVVEVDNVCIPIHTTTRPTAVFVNSIFLAADESAPMAQEFELHGNYPNPFNPSTTIKFSTEMFSNVKVTIYNTLGQEVTTLFNNVMNAGTYELNWFGRDKNGAAVPTGMYFYRIQSNDRVLDGKMLLLK